MENNTIVLGGGCFWCLEAVFQNLKGVKRVTSGYSGGEIANPSYEQVCSGKTGHIEVVEIEYDVKAISYEEILQVFFKAHDPTTLNRQGADIGTQYASVIFYSSAKEKEKAENFIANLQDQYHQPIVTKVLPLKKFYPAEAYHQNYFKNHKNAPYCQAVIKPKVEKIT